MGHGDGIQRHGFGFCIRLSMSVSGFLYVPLCADLSHQAPGLGNGALSDCLLIRGCFRTSMHVIPKQSAGTIRQEAREP